jgi:hypothetical protein
MSVSFKEDAKPDIPAMQEFIEDKCKLGFYLDNVKEIELKNVVLEGVVGEALVANHYDRIETEGFEQK